MKRILLIVFSAFPVILLAQLPDLQSRQNRTAFLLLTDNTIIKNAGIQTERIYTHTTDTQGNTDSILTEEIKYNDMGFAVLSTEFTSSGNIQKTYSYIFNSNGQISKLSIEIKKPGFKPHFTQIKYDDAGKEISKYDYDGNHENKITLLKEYNAKGQCTYLKYLHADKKYYTAKAYYYDPGGYLEKAELFFGHNSPTPAKTYVYKTMNSRETVWLYEADTAYEMASFIYNTKGACVNQVQQQRKYKTSPFAPGGDHHVTLYNDRGQGINSIPETYTVSGNGIVNSNTSSVLAERTGTPQNVISAGNLSVVPVKQEAGNVVTGSFSGTYFYYNADGTISSEIFSEDMNGLAVSKKHFYYR